ncbi:DMT family transporter [Craterilacuibacter sp.]|uniref:DMT family transporter n=1 Tax=Craterilacuibacter sp. TaxID=2870909 RepID=UPI003F2C3EAD
MTVSPRLALWLRLREGRLGAGWMVLAALSFALMGVFVKIGARSFPSTELLFWRTLLGAIALSAVMWLRGQSPLTANFPAHLKRSSIGYVSMAMLFYALSHLPLSTAITLNYTSPLFFVLLCMLKLRDRPTPMLVLALALGFAGMVLLLKPGFDSDAWLATLIGLGSGVCAGLAVFQVRELGQLGEPSWRTVFWFFWIASGFGLLLLLCGPGFTTLSADNILPVLGIALFGLAGQLAMTRAYQEGRRFLVASLAYVTVVFSALFGAVLWGEPMGADSLLAITLVILSGVLAARR